MTSRALALTLALAACRAPPPPPPAPPPRPPGPVPGTVVPKAEAWRRSPPPAVAELPPIVPHARKTLTGGVELVVIPRPEASMFTLAVVFGSGEAHDPPALRGLSAVTLSLLLEPPEGMSAESVQALRREHRLQLFTETQPDHLVLAIRASRWSFAEASRYLVELVRQPRLLESAVRARAVAAQKERERRLESPDFVARAKLMEVVHGPDTPLATPIDRRRLVGKLDRRAVIDRHAELIAPNRLRLVLVGPFTADDAVARLDPLVRRWPIDPAPAAKPRRAPAPPAPRAVVVHKPGVTQASVCLARALVPREHPDRLPLLALTQIVGGGLGSRMSRRLREELGYTYGVEARARFTEAGGDFVLCSTLPRERLGAAIAELRTELEDLRREPPGDDEIRAATFGLAARGRIEVETDRELVGAVARGGADPFAGPGAALLALPPERVREAARTYLDPAAMSWVLVGESRPLVRAIEEAGLPGPSIVELR